MKTKRGQNMYSIRIYDDLSIYNIFYMSMDNVSSCLPCVHSARIEQSVHAFPNEHCWHSCMQCKIQPLSGNVCARFNSSRMHTGASLSTDACNNKVNSKIKMNAIKYRKRNYMGI